MPRRLVYWIYIYESQLICTINNISERMNDKIQTDAITTRLFSGTFLRHSTNPQGNENFSIRELEEKTLSNRSQSVVVEEFSSDNAPVLSGVPQGNVLGPLLFLVYIDDLPECVSSDTGIFAQDTLLHWLVPSPDDAIALQADLTSLEKWERKWSMDFNPSTFEVLHITNKPNPVNSEYHLHGDQLGVTKGRKNLGVTITKVNLEETHREGR